jgi:hypothetical protein
VYCSGFGNLVHVDDAIEAAERICSFVVVKVIMGVNLVSYATKRKAGMEAREAEDTINDFGRDPIGEGREEQVCTVYSNPPQALILRRSTIVNSKPYWTISEMMHRLLRRSGNDVQTSERGRRPA